MADRDLASEVGELKGRVDSLATIANKLDVIIERLVDIHDRHIAKVYDDMEKRRMENQEQIKEIHDRIDTVIEKVQDTEKNVMEKIEKLQKCITDHNSKEKEQIDEITEKAGSKISSSMKFALLKKRYAKMSIININNIENDLKQENYIIKN